MFTSFNISPWKSFHCTVILSATNQFLYSLPSLCANFVCIFRHIFIYIPAIEQFYRFVINLRQRMCELFLRLCVHIYSAKCFYSWQTIQMHLCVCAYERKLNVSWMSASNLSGNICWSLATVKILIFSVAQPASTGRNPIVYCRISRNVSSNVAKMRVAPKFLRYSLYRLRTPT